MNDKNIAIIGGYGFIGQHLQAQLKQLKCYKNIYVVGHNKSKKVYFKEN